MYTITHPRSYWDGLVLNLSEASANIAVVCFLTDYWTLFIFRRYGNVPNHYKFLYSRSHVHILSSCTLRSKNATKNQQVETSLNNPSNGKRVTFY